MMARHLSVFEHHVGIVGSPDYYRPVDDDLPAGAGAFHYFQVQFARHGRDHNQPWPADATYS
jgi:hypothetical protein